MDPQLTREENRTQLKSKFKAFVNTCLEISIHNDLKILVSRSCNFSIAKKIYAERKHISVRCFANSSRRGGSLRQGWGYFSSGSGEFSGWLVFLTRESLIFFKPPEFSITKLYISSKQTIIKSNKMWSALCKLQMFYCLGNMEQAELLASFWLHVMDLVDWFEIWKPR